MCRIGINLTNSTPNGTSIVSALGQYRLVGSSTWINFTIILNKPQTPDIIDLGSYELRVNVTNNVDDTSEWSNISTFQISTNCTPSSGGGGSSTVTITPDYNLSRSTSTAPSCDGFVASTFPNPVKNYNSMRVGSSVTYANGLPFPGTGQWYYYLSADSISTTSKTGVRINSAGTITEIGGCFVLE